MHAAPRPVGQVEADEVRFGFHKGHCQVVFALVPAAIAVCTSANSLLCFSNFFAVHGRGQALIVILEGIVSDQHQPLLLSHVSELVVQETAEEKVLPVRVNCGGDRIFAEDAVEVLDVSRHFLDGFDLGVREIVFTVAQNHIFGDCEDLR